MVISALFTDINTLLLISVSTMFNDIALIILNREEQE